MNVLGWKIIFCTDEVIGFNSVNMGDIWLVSSDVNELQNYDAKGFNHLAIKVEEQNDIKILLDFLKIKNIKTIFDTPKHRPEFANNDKETYYQIMFETPDRILFEIVYIGLKKHL